MLCHPVIEGHDPAFTVPGVESLSLELLPLGFGDQVALHPYQGLISWAGLGAHPGSKHLGCDGGLAGVRPDAWQVFGVQHCSVATAPESYRMGGGSKPTQQQL